MAHVDMGSGRPLLILHGLLGSKRNWQGIAKVLAAHFRTVAVATHEDWLEANRYINMKLLKEHKRDLMKEAA